MVFRAKFKADGSLDRYKARLVAQGFTQLPGFDYCHTFSPVVQASTIPVVLSIVVSNNWPLHQLDVQNAFLNDVLSKAIYMEQPPGFIDPQFPNHVCRLKKAIYGLKQASLAWYQRLSDFLVHVGFFYDLKSFISRLHQEFAITDLGKLGYFFGLEVTYTSSGIFLNQAKYARDILQRASLEESKPVSTPLVAGCQLSTDGQPFEDPTLYRSLVGLLQYLTITRPDLSFDVNLVSQHLQHPTIAHFQAVKRILRYVKHTPAFGLSFTCSSSFSLVAYSDADWARCVETRRSTYGYSIFLGGNLVSWSAKKQPTVSRSSCESEYRALANTSSEMGACFQWSARDSIRIIRLTGCRHFNESSPSPFVCIFQRQAPR
ncbi:uncharacterized mitochondrial protein AtMg00810-like [Salvia splendens]|uniref:uncharacterized mitochondrial protein AtMg00810-like n=1 Tax=Salvia splendens TaxID=180675 RepID=UPI001C27239D|nr:uncharacterized mitochondrial protein AtMg00810-like [Salvia splendens]